MSGPHLAPQESEQLVGFLLRVSVSRDVSIEAEGLFRFLFRPLTARPVESALRGALVERLERCIVPLLENREPFHFRKGDNRIKLGFSPFKTADVDSNQISEIAELLGWVAPVSKKGYADELLNDICEALLKRGDEHSRVFSFHAREWQRGRPGPPIKKRRIAVEAYDLQLQDKKQWTWSKLAKKLCNCGAQHHGNECRETLRREVGHLKRLLDRYHIPIPQTPWK
jgi:hypothetical protein